MVSENTKLNIERARAALAKARAETQNDAVRTPRPVDLSRLAELEQRRDKLEARAGEFRLAVRERLGLSDLGTDRVSVRSIMGSATMDGALCDADICAPPAPRLPGDTRALQTPKAKPEMRTRRASVNIRVKPKRKKFLGLF